MDESYQFKSFSLSQVDEVLAFASQCPWKPEWPQDLMRRFLTELSSGPSMVLDVHLGRYRQGVAVIVDKIQNRGNDATFEILGLDPRADFAAVYATMIAAAIRRVPNERSGLEFTNHSSWPMPQELIRKHQLIPYFETFAMVRESLKDVLPAKRFALATEADDRAHYDVLVKSFAENLDASIPAFADWRAGKARSQNMRTLLARHEGKIVGFLTLIAPAGDTAEIRTVGVLPEMRGKGLGRDLILSALQEAARLGFQKCELTVAVQNRHALELYRSLQFREVDHFQIHRWIKAGTSS